MAKKYLPDTEFFVNRELSFIGFDTRILNEARDKSIPLFERLKFLSISASNLDEFFMVRIASLKDMVNAGYTGVDIAGMTPQMQLTKLSEVIHELTASQYSILHKSLTPKLKEIGIEVVYNYDDLTDGDRKKADKYFRNEIYPVLTPMAVDSSRPFPLIRNKTLNLGALLQKKENITEPEFAMVQVPDILPRLFCIRSEDIIKIVFLEDVIINNIDKLFANHEILTVGTFRIMRNADLSIEEEEAEDLLKEIEKQLHLRQWGEVIRLDTDKKADPRLRTIIQRELGLSDENVYLCDGPVDLTFLSDIYKLEGFEQYKIPHFIPHNTPAITENDDAFEEIKKRDILLHHPYDSFSSVEEFIRQAAEDDKVLAIKQTLYRVGSTSPVIKSLAKAAENGKQVTVLVELKARFDEETNIQWAKMLEKAGAHVIYGLPGLKTHCKITLVVRKEEKGIKRYVHLSTGNYNEITAGLYTDIGLLTCRKSMGEDATEVFNMLSGFSKPLNMKKLSLAPIDLKGRFLELINNEIKNVKNGGKGHILAKMNSLCDPDIIKALYDASSAGVRIELIIRGICCLHAGHAGFSENISVRSIVGNFLEHSRVFVFGNNGEPLVFCGSADWMPRNLERRVEILFPIEDKAAKSRIQHILATLLEDNVNASILYADDTYQKPDRRGKKRICAQEIFCEE